MDSGFERLERPVLVLQISGFGGVVVLAAFTFIFGPVARSKILLVSR
jgi:hypothetical protein